MYSNFYLFCICILGSSTRAVAVEDSQPRTSSHILFRCWSISLCKKPKNKNIEIKRLQTLKSHDSLLDSYLQEARNPLVLKNRELARVQSPIFLHFFVPHFISNLLFLFFCRVLLIRIYPYSYICFIFFRTDFVLLIAIKTLFVVVKMD